MISFFNDDFSLFTFIVIYFDLFLPPYFLTSISYYHLFDASFSLFFFFGLAFLVLKFICFLF